MDCCTVVATEHLSRQWAKSCLFFKQLSSSLPLSTVVTAGSPGADGGAGAGAVGVLGRYLWFSPAVDDGPLSPPPK